MFQSQNSGRIQKVNLHHRSIGVQNCRVCIMHYSILYYTILYHTIIEESRTGGSRFLDPPGVLGFRTSIPTSDIAF